MNYPPKLYAHIHPTDQRIRMVCEPCRIDRVCLTIDEAKRDVRAHRAFHDRRNAA